jgi:hypothetical protein
MSWKAITKNFELLRELDDEGNGTGLGRPMQQGENNELLVIAEEDFGRKVAVDLINGVIIIDYDTLSGEGGMVNITNPRFVFLIADETNIAGEYKHVTQELVDYIDEQGRKVIQDGEYVKVRNDILTSIVWRPIWFTRWTNGMPTRVIGAQTTTPEIQGNKNVKKLISIYGDGRIGID